MCRDVPLAIAVSRSRPAGCILNSLFFSPAAAARFEKERQDKPKKFEASPKIEEPNKGRKLVQDFLDFRPERRGQWDQTRTQTGKRRRWSERKEVKMN